MSEEIKKMSLLDLFSQAAQTLEQAEAKAKEEKGAERIEKFRMPDAGEYIVRVAPLAPVVGEDGKPIMPMDRRGCDFPLSCMTVQIKGNTDKKGKTPKKYAYFIRSTQPGVDKSIDLVDEYNRIAKEIYADDEEVMDMLTSSESKNRLYWQRKRAMYVYDVTDMDKPKGPMLWTVSFKQWQAIDEERRSVWGKVQAKKGEKCPDPLCSPKEAWPLTVTKTGSGLTTTYAFKIDRGEDQYDLDDDKMQAIFDAPRLPDEIYRFSRYMVEAELAFLQQYDEEHDLEVCKDQEFLEAVEKIKGELAPDDNSHFTFANGSSDSKDGKASQAITLESLNEAYDYIVDNNLTKDSDEYEELQEDIRQFIEDNNLDVIVKRSKKIPDLLDEIEEALADAKVPEGKGVIVDAPKAEEPAKDPEEAEEEEEVPARPARRRPARPVVEEDNDDESEEVVEEAKQEEPAEAEDDAAHRRRRLRR